MLNDTIYLTSPIDEQNGVMAFDMNETRAAVNDLLVRIRLKGLTAV